MHQYTLGSCDLIITLNKPNKLISHQFQIISDNFNIGFDGVIGNDLLKLFQVNIDYLSNRLKFGSYYIPIYHSVRLGAKPDICIKLILSTKLIQP